MNIVGKELEQDGFEFLAVNSKLKKDPQFVCVKERVKYFIVVRAVGFPHDPETYDMSLMQKMKRHAEKFEARTFYAGVGLVNPINHELPLEKDVKYLLNYGGLKEIL